MSADDDAAPPSLEALADRYGVPRSLLRAIVEGFGRCSLEGAMPSSEPAEMALRAAVAGASIRALWEHWTRRDLRPYARDRVTTRLSETLAPVFGEGAWIPCPSATAASALALRFLAGEGPGAVFAESIGHAMTLEAGALAATSGGRVLPIAVSTDSRGRMGLESFEEAILTHCPGAADTTLGRDHFPTPAVLVLSWPSVFGFELSMEELQAFRAQCDVSGIRIVLDFVWGLHKAAECVEPERRIVEVMQLVDAAIVSLPKIDCGPGALAFFPRQPIGALDRLRALAKPLGYAQFEAWDVSVRWESVWRSYRSELWSTLQGHNHRASRIRAAVAERGFDMEPPSAGNVVFVSAAPDIARRLVEHGAAAWPLRTRHANHRVVRMLIASWYPPAWDDALIRLVDEASTPSSPIA